MAVCTLEDLRGMIHLLPTNWALLYYLQTIGHLLCLLLGVLKLLPLFVVLEHQLEDQTKTKEHQLEDQTKTKEHSIIIPLPFDCVN